MKKVIAGELNNFLRSCNCKVDPSIKDMMRIGRELGYLYDEDILYMATASEHEAQRRLTTRRKGIFY